MCGCSAEAITADGVINLVWECVLFAWLCGGVYMRICHNGVHAKICLHAKLYLCKRATETLLLVDAHAHRNVFSDGGGGAALDTYMRST